MNDQEDYLVIVFTIKLNVIITCVYYPKSIKCVFEREKQTTKQLRVYIM